MASKQFSGPGYLNPKLSIRRRVEDLLGRMSLEEKAGQMVQYLIRIRAADAGNPDAVAGSPYDKITANDLERMTAEGRIGSFLTGAGLLGPSIVDTLNRFQRAAESSRLKIPVLMGVDAIHGLGFYRGATIHPAPIGLGATFDEDLVRRTAAATARESRAMGFAWVFNPNVEVARDMRWGRVDETFGEDPHLVARLGVAIVEGSQGRFDPATTVLACAKHFIGGSHSIDGRNHGPCDISERTLRSVLLPPFRACVRAGAGSVMIAHNEVNGHPCHGSSWLIQDLLKKEMRFRFFTVSDWLDVYRLETVHHVVDSRAQADLRAVMAGLDMNMHGPGFYDEVLDFARRGMIPMQRIDDAVRRILAAKFKLGLFEHRYAKAQSLDIIACEAHTEVALEAARKSIVLLKNEEGALPLPRGLKRIFVTGPHAGSSQTIYGDWVSGQPEGHAASIADGLRAKVGDALDYFDCGLFENLDETVIAQAASRARGADAAIVAVGEIPIRVDHDGVRTEGENLDRNRLNLPGRQLELVQAIAATGVKTIVVFINGGPISEPWIAGHIPAVVEAFYPGMAGGQAVAEVLFGEINPSGRLPYSIPRGAGFLHSWYNRPPSGLALGEYSQVPYEHNFTALYPFGFGLSYTTFEYSDLRAPDRIKAGEDIALRVTVTNTGGRAGEEAVLVFVRDVVSRLTRPVKELKAFKRVNLQSGQSATVEFTLTPEDLMFINERMKPELEPGEFRIMVGELETIVTVAE